MMKSTNLDRFDIYVNGVGGQGIGMLSELLVRAIDHSGQVVRGADTHGLAQRGGAVVSYIRVGKDTFSPIIGRRKAHLAVSLERHEAMRVIVERHLVAEGVLIYYDAVWQPLDVRLGKHKQLSNKDLASAAEDSKLRVIRVFREDLADARMHNTVLLAEIAYRNLIPGVTLENYKQAMDDLMEGALLERNLKLFEKHLAERQRDTFQ